MIPEGYDLEDWMRTKISQMADDVGEVYHALDHRQDRGVDIASDKIDKIDKIANRIAVKLVNQVKMPVVSGFKFVVSRLTGSATYHLEERDVRATSVEIPLKSIKLSDEGVLSGLAEFRSVLVGYESKYQDERTKSFKWNGQDELKKILSNAKRTHSALSRRR
jgi:hypothetical protein